ncbi:hypothetical protein [Hydrogenimonas sp.]
MKIFFTLFFLIGALYADIDDAKIVKEILLHLKFANAHKLFTPYPAFKSILREDFNVTSRCDEADLVIVKYPEDLPKHCPLPSQAVFGLDYKLLHRYPNAFGAFYWKKGRPNITLIGPRTRRLKIEIPDALEKYTEDRVW